AATAQRAAVFRAWKPAAGRQSPAPRRLSGGGQAIRRPTTRERPKSMIHTRSVSPRRSQGRAGPRHSPVCIALLAALFTIGCERSRSRSARQGPTVLGQVLTVDGRPITGATIRSVDGSLTTRTLPDGRFRIDTPAGGPRAVLLDARTGSPASTF